MQLAGTMVAARQPRDSPDPVPTGLVAARPRVGSPGELGHPWAQLLQPVRAQSCMEGARAAWGGHTVPGRVRGVWHGAG